MYERREADSDVSEMKINNPVWKKENMSISDENKLYSAGNYGTYNVGG